MADIPPFKMQIVFQGGTGEHMVAEVIGDTAAELAERFGDVADIVDHRRLTVNERVLLADAQTKALPLEVGLQVRKVMNSLLGVPDTDLRQVDPDAAASIQRGREEIATKKPWRRHRARAN